MKRNSLLAIVLFTAVLVTGMPVFAAPLATNARSVIPNQVQQIINVDYRRMKNSDTAMQMKAKLMPPNMKQFEDALKNIGVNVDRDVDQITLAAFRSKDKNLRLVGIAQGMFPRKKLLAKIQKQKIKAKKLNGSFVYPMSGGMVMTFLDDNTMLFGDQSAVQASLDARDDSAESLNANSQVTDMIASVDSGTLWSVLDAKGTQTMIQGALGSASSLSEFDDIKKKLVGSRYTVDFDHGVDFNLNVVTSDNITAATLASVLKAGMLFKKMNATPTEKTAIDDTSVDSDAGKLVVHFKADDKSFQSLLDSPMFAAVTH
ncbi:MAG TPA: hypothetical protein VN669_03370 [Candidatus Acidoferrales bacterium]|jgi:hypothetical protein|nr:hypothetical protein [Candidatus Acidoferrales bacterium]